MVMYYVTRDEEENQDQLMVILSGQVRCIDGSAPDYERILDGLRSNPDMSAEDAISLIDGEQNEIEAMSEGMFTFRRGRLYDAEGHAVPDNVSEQCRRRMEQGADSYESLMRFYQRLMTLPTNVREEFIAYVEDVTEPFILDDSGNMLVWLSHYEVEAQNVTIDREPILDILDDEELDLDEVFVPGSRLENQNGFTWSTRNFGDYKVSVAPEDIYRDEFYLRFKVGAIVNDTSAETLSFENPYAEMQESNGLEGEFHGSFDEDDC